MLACRSVSSTLVSSANMARDRKHRRVPAGIGPSPMPRWFHPLLLALSAALLMGWFSPEISDPDFWWHLKTGQYLLQAHSLPVPDPFAYTTTMGSPAYAGELRTRHFNLTHEWLAQAMLYAVYRAGGFGGVVLFRAALLALVCAIVGLVAYRRSGGFY